MSHEIKNKQINSPILYRLVRPLGVLLTRGIFRPRVIGKENIPKTGGVVLAGNHQFVLDPLVIAIATKRCVHFLAKKEIFKYRFTNWFMRNCGIIPVHRQRKDSDALAAAKQYLTDGEVVGIFPEGTIIKPDDVRLLPFKFGAVKMAKDTGCPIVPFTINGSYIPFQGRLEIVFQEPIYITGEDLEEENDDLRERVAGNLKPRKGNCKL